MTKNKRDMLRRCDVLQTLANLSVFSDDESVQLNAKAVSVVNAASKAVLEMPAAQHSSWDDAIRAAAAVVTVGDTVTKIQQRILSLLTNNQGPSTMEDTDWRPSRCPHCGDWREAARNPVCPNKLCPGLKAAKPTGIGLRDAPRPQARGCVMEAGVYTARGIGDLSDMVRSLAEQGFRIITVIDTQNGDYHVVAQKDRPHD